MRSQFQNLRNFLNRTGRPRSVRLSRNDDTRALPWWCSAAWQCSVDQWLVIGDGIETTLSVMQACSLPGWAALSANGITSLILPREATMVLICAATMMLAVIGWRVPRTMRRNGSSVKVGVFASLCHQPPRRISTTSSLVPPQRR